MLPEGFRAYVEPTISDRARVAQTADRWSSAARSLYGESLIDITMCVGTEVGPGLCQL